MNAELMLADGWTWCFERKIASDPIEGRMVVAELLGELERRHWDETDVFAVHLALEEALVNAIKHGNHKDRSKSVDVVCRLKADRVQIECGAATRGLAGSLRNARPPWPRWRDWTLRPVPAASKSRKRKPRGHLRRSPCPRVQAGAGLRSHVAAKCQRLRPS